MQCSECLDVWCCGGWRGIYSPQPPNRRWGRLQSMGVPDSPVRHRTGTVGCLVRRHITQPLGFRSSRSLALLTSCGIGQSDAALDNPCSLSGAPLTLRSDSSVHCSSVQQLLQSTVVQSSRCSAGAPDSPVPHRTVR
jgi:hypothetical protein